jgi:hypothetical protein
MLEGFDFKILHRLGAKHDNVDMFSHDPIGIVEEDEYFSKEIKDIWVFKGDGNVHMDQ